MLSTLYSVEINTINYHIKKIYNDNELKEESFGSIIFSRNDFGL